MDKEDVVHLDKGILLSHKKEWNWVMCRDMDGPRDCHTEWSKPGRWKQNCVTGPVGPSLENAEGPSCVLHQRNVSRAWHLPVISIAIDMVLFSPLMSHTRKQKNCRDGNVAPTVLRGDFIFLPVGLSGFSMTWPIWQCDQKKKIS